MKPVAVIRFSPTEGPGYLAEYLNEHAIPWHLVRMDAGDPIPARVDQLSGVAMMGGPMSVNDPLPWMNPLIAMIQQALDRDVPLIGHCLGGQLIAKAMGGEVTNNKCKEMGWQTVEVVNPEAARPWFGAQQSFTVFQWHYQTFEIPKQASHLLRNDFCENQAFSVGPHIGFQCHIEMTAPMVKTWCSMDADEILHAEGLPAVQPLKQILAEKQARVKSLNQLAHGVYHQWASKLQF
jgi:GMP synthase-like glutamine amidotransferase